MNREENKLDDQLRNRLEQFSPEPPPEIWKRIQAGMAREKRSTRLIVVRWAAVAAVLLIALVTGVLITNHPAGTKFPAASVKTDSVRQAVPSTPFSKKLSTVNAGVMPVIPAPAYIAVSSRPVSIPAVSEENSVTRRENHAILTTISGLAQVQSPLERLENQEPENKLIARHETLCAVKQPPAENRPLPESENTKKYGSRKTPAEWEIGVHLSPAYSSHSSSYSASYASNMSTSGNQSQTGIGGGVSVQYKTSRRWKIESGLYYARSGDKSGNSGHLYASVTDNQNLSGNGYKYYSNAVSVQNGQISMNSAAGIIHFTGTPANATLVAGSESALDMNSTLLASGKFYQVFDFVEVPLTARYRILDGKIGLELLSGISTNFVVGNEVFMENSSTREYVGKTGDIARFGFSGVAGFGVIYPLNKKISLSFEPQASYWLNSLNNSADVVFRPWRISFYSGLTYSF